MNIPANRYQPGDKVQYRANLVEGYVTRNLGPSINTETGNDVIEWRDPEGGLCVHDAAKLANLTAPSAHLR